MQFRKVTAIVQCSALEAVERSLQQADVKGVTVTRVKGYGEYADFFARDWMSEHVRLEIFTHRQRVDGILEAIFRAASTGTKGDGIVAVLPVESVFRIRDRAAADPDDPAVL